MSEPASGPEGSSGRPVFRSLRRRRRPTGPPYRLIGGLVLLALVAGGAWYWLRSRSQEPVEPAVPEAAAPEGSMGLSEEPPPLDLPALDASDAMVRELVAQLSARPRLAEWLVTDELVRRFVTSVVNIAAGGSPAEHLAFMDPEAPFEVRESDGRLLVDPASYARYDPLVQTFLSIDTGDAARLYRQLHPLFEEAYAELGLTDRTFDETLADAMGYLVAVDVPDPPVEVEPLEAVYAYADPSLEALTPAEKHLLRLGPDNARRVQAKLVELADALGLDIGVGGA